jgi:hypothetical protein
LFDWLRKLLHKGPHIHRVIKAWEEKGTDCWLLPYKDFNCLYNGENVIVTPEGKVCATLTFGNHPIIVYRQESGE